MDNVILNDIIDDFVVAAYLIFIKIMKLSRNCFNYDVKYAITTMTMSIPYTLIFNAFCLIIIINMMIQTQHNKKELIIRLKILILARICQVCKFFV